MALKYRTKPVVIEAWPWDGSLTQRGVCNCHHGFETSAPHLHTMHENQIVFLSEGDWIVPEPNGKGHYPIKSDVFAAKYELA